MFRAIGITIGTALIAWAVSVASSSRAEEKAAETENHECTYQGETYEAGALECWSDGFWHRCDGKTGKWINMRQKCKLI